MNSHLPDTSQDIARLMGVWPTGPDGLYDDLVSYLGRAHADRLWDIACDLRETATPTLPKEAA